MPSIRLIGALLLSLTLVGGAFWFRFSKTPPHSAELISVQGLSEFASDEAFLSDFIGTTTAPTRPFSTTTLSQTELVSRQIFTDYMSLKSRGEVSSEDLLSLADQYAAEIIRTDISANEVTPNQILVAPDTVENFAAYGEAVTNIRQKYRALTSARYPGGQLTDINNKTFLSFLSESSILYKGAANELLLVRVPLSLSGNHLSLVNGYFENAEALKLFASTSKNPLEGYAAFNFFVKNIEREADLMLYIQRVLLANGIIFNSQI